MTQNWAGKSAASSGAFYNSVPEMAQASGPPWRIGAGMRADPSDNPMAIPSILYSPPVCKARSHPPPHNDTTLLFEAEIIPIRQMKKTEAQRRQVT